MKAKRVVYEGKVQGVGFRYSARTTAKEYEVTGSVRNLPDGRVELLACGETEEVEGFLQAIRDGSVGGHIAREVCEDVELQESPKGFQIVS